MKHLNSQNPRFATIKSSSFGTQTIPCLFGEVKGKRLVVQTEAPIIAYTTVTVEYDDAMFLGEVVVCNQDAGAFSIEIKVEQVLSGLQSLMALRAQLLGAAPANVPMVPTFVSQRNQAFA